MDKKPDDIQQGITETRHAMAETRASMTDKLEAIEERVRDTVEGAQSTGEDMLESVKGTIAEAVGAVKDTMGEARSTVAGMVENVKDTMDDTVTTVKRTLDVNHQVDQHPWVMLSGAVVMGYLLGGLGTRSPARSYRTRRAWTGTEAKRSGYFATTAIPEAETPPASSSQPQARRSRLWQSALGQFQEEFDLLKGAALTALLSNVREMVKQSWPAIAPQVEQAIESATAKLGGQPLTHGKQEEPRAAGPARERREQPPTI